MSLKNRFSYGSAGILLLLLISLCLVSGNDFTISPTNAKVGTVVTISGSTTPNTAVGVQVNYQKIIPTTNGGSYLFLLQNIVIPSGSNAFTVKGTGVQSMSVGLKQSIWTTVTAKVVNGVATVSQSNIPAGTYSAVVYGKAVKTSVTIDVTASKTLISDAKGNYAYSYNSAGMPAGVYTVKIGSVTKSFTLK